MRERRINTAEWECPAIGPKQTWVSVLHISAFGRKAALSASPPKRTLQSRSGNSAKNFSPIGRMFDQHFSDYKPIRFAGQWRERNGPVFYRLPDMELRYFRCD